MGFFDLGLLVEDKYNDWIHENYPTSQSAYLQCAEATLAMIEAFPELIRVRGLAHVEEPWDLPPTKAPHWWCEDLAGLVIDPTAHQYPTKILQYDAFDEELGEPTGKCPNCGNLCHYNKYLCTQKCEDEYMTYLNGPRK